MNTDQNLLYRTCRALIDGVCDSSLARRKIGKISFARWLTLAIRINMCYMSTRKPSTGLVILTKFVVTIYAKLWFESKLRWRATDAPSLYFKAMKLIAKLKDSKPKITSEKFQKVKETFERGFGYWGHSENILLAMLASENKDERARAVARISTLRGIQRQGQEKEKSAQAEDEEKEDSVRIFQVPKPVYSAQSYEEMIDWDKEQVCPPPYVQFHTDEEIQEYVVTPLKLDVPSNSQHVERFIQVNAKVGTKAVSNRDRNGLVFARQKYQKENPNKENKPCGSKQ